MNDEIKSAREIAMEKISRAGGGNATGQAQVEICPRGRAGGAEILQRRPGHCCRSLQLYPEAQAFVRAGAEEVLLSNIQLPINESVQNRNKKAMDGILSVKKDKNGATKLLNQMKQIWGTTRTREPSNARKRMKHSNGSSKSN